MDLLSSVLENNELWVVFDDSVISEAEIEPNMDVGVTAEETPNKLVDLVSSVLVESKEKLPNVGLDPKIGALGVFFSKIFVEDLLPKRNDVGWKDCDVLLVDVTRVLFDSETLTGISSCSLHLSIS